MRWGRFDEPIAEEVSVVAVVVQRDADGSPMLFKYFQIVLQSVSCSSRSRRSPCELNTSGFAYKRESEH